MTVRAHSSNLVAMTTQPDTFTDSATETAGQVPPETPAPRPAQPGLASADATYVRPPAGWYAANTPGPYGPQTSWYPLPPTRQTRMRRSDRDKMLLGVCGGIAEHTGIDPVYIRLGFLVSLFWGGIGLVAYIAAALVMPKPQP